VRARIAPLAILLALALAGPAHALYANLDFYWPGAGTGAVVIPTCWENPGAVPAALRATIQDAAESSWQRHARVSFTEWDQCGAGDPGIHILITFAGPSSAPHGVNLNGVTDGVKLNLDCSLPCIGGRSVAIHELGHVLGYYHEEERPDYAEPPGTQPGTACAKQTYPNSSPQYYGAFDLDSVMSYCGALNTELSPGDVAAVQRSYGRRLPGSLVSPGGHCATGWPSGFEGAVTFLRGCDETGDQTWAFELAAGRFSLQGPAGPRCLQPAGSAAVLVTCDPAADVAQRWRLASLALRGWGGLCLDLQGGRRAAGTPVQMWTCAAGGSATQRWTITPAGEIRFAGAKRRCLTVPASGTAYLSGCTRPALQRFQLAAGGQIRLAADPSLCLDVQAWTDGQYLAGLGLPQSGQRVQAFACLSQQLNQRWHASGAIRHKASGRCLARAAGGESAGTGLELAACDAGGAQTWDYHWLPA